MIKSLTGFGNAEISAESTQLNIILRSVNSRFLDVKFRGIEIEPALEIEIRKTVQKTLQRGSVQVQIYTKNNVKNGNSIKFDRGRFESIEKIIHTIQRDYGRHLELGELISFNDLVTQIDVTDITNAEILKGINEALKQLDEMRKTEGKSISTDIIKRLELIQKSLVKLENISKKYVIDIKESYQNKIKLLLNDVNINEDRLAQELAIIIDRSDFTEEIVRSKSHCEQFNNFLSAKEPVGKKLNFILQELSREVNTIGSKSSNIDVSKIVVELKSEIEKIREQVQNIL